VTKRTQQQAGVTTPSEPSAEDLARVARIAAQREQAVRDGRIVEEMEASDRDRVMLYVRDEHQRIWRDARKRAKKEKLPLSIFVAMTLATDEREQRLRERLAAEYGLVLPRVGPLTVATVAALGGRARAAKLSPERRREIASHAAKQRWARDDEFKASADRMLQKHRKSLDKLAHQ
jgi:hypothetical protein